MPESNDVMLRRTLQENGHRYTDQRAAVFRLVARTTVHPTAEDVFLGVRTEAPGISLATVYKSLEMLVNCGLVKKLNPTDGSARFCGRKEPHHHARCLACGGVSDVPGELGDVEITALRKQAQGFHLLGYDLELTGYCSDCAPPAVNGSSTTSN
jgi:Fur family peroxide stress response transcriptional regulator